MQEIARSAPGLPWLPAPERPPLGHNEIHIWRAALNLEPVHIHDLRRSLSPDEQARADRFHFEKDQVQYIATRGILRFILGCYAGFKPSQLFFSYNPYGKPALINQPFKEKLCFNISHSHGLALYAVAKAREVGVDVERIEPEVARKTIAEQFFSRQEINDLRRLPPNLQPEAFFNCWTRKEAYIKARGKGLSIPLDEFDVSLVPGQPAALLHTRGDPEDVLRWSLRELVPGEGYAAAIAAEGHRWHVNCWQWAGN
jgi:4'-phosphopantetheinyl transferase